MITAVLTMDDGPTKLTLPIMEYLQKKNIQPVFFCIGEHIKKRMADAIQAVQMGAILGNHTMTHPFLNEISYEMAIEEIEETERLLDCVYQWAGKKREVKLFRFPYGVHSGDNFEKIQKYLRYSQFTRVEDGKCVQNWYAKQEFTKYLDVAITFSFDEWRTHDETGYRLPQIIEHIEDNQPADGCPLLEKNSHHIVVLHDHEKTNDIIEDYYKIILDYVIEKGVTFISPTFLGY